MHIPRLLLAALCAGVLTLSIGHSSALPNAAPPMEKDKPKFKLPSGHELMTSKLKNSQSVLEGIALNDFAKITKSTEELMRIAQVAEFLNAYKGKEYELQMLLFKRAADTMKQKAKDKNMDGVLLAYNDMTMTCLKCHQYVRDVGDASTR